MIVRKEKDALLLVGQTDHSRLVGQVAAHWGNATFDAPKPYESVVRAAMFHDYGWLRYETSPLLDAESGAPYSFLQVPLTPTQMASYQWSLDWMTDIDPYAGLIVSVHRTGLWKSRYGTITHPMGYNLKSPSKEIVEFIERNEERQKALRAEVDDGTFDFNYKLMQVWDLLGLYFCCQDPYADHVNPVPTKYGNREGAEVEMKMEPVGPRKVKFDPFPFDLRPCHIQLTYKKMPKNTYANVAEFRKAYFQAGTQVMDFELV